MNAKSTISCECGCLFEISFQKSSNDTPPKCPQCNRIMNDTSWNSLRNIMAELADFNQHILKWSSERNEPKMIVPAITVQTFEN